MKIQIHPTIIAMSLLVSGFLLGYWLLVMPALTSMASARKSVEASTKSGEVRTKTASTTTSKEDGLAFVNGLLPEDDQQYSLGVTLEDTARNSGVPLTALTFTSVDSTGTPTAASQTDTAAIPAGVKRVTVVLSVHGTYANIQKFIASLGKLDRYVKIDQLMLSTESNSVAPAGSATAGDLDANITAFAYYFPPIKAAAPVATAAPKPDDK